MAETIKYAPTLALKIKFSEVSWPIKVGVIAGWVFAILWTAAFLFGFFASSLGWYY